MSTSTPDSPAADPESAAPNDGPHLDGATPATQLTLGDVDKLARLSRLSLSPDEKGEILGDLQRILGYIETVLDVDVEGIEPLIHPGAGVFPTRADEVQPGAGLDAIRGSAGFENRFVRVPKVIEEAGS